jgi:hypothetical protein
MKFHNAAALALVGWYLMVPPQSWMSSITQKPCSPFEKGAWPYPKKTSLNNWGTVRSFDSANECEGSLQQALNSSTANMRSAEAHCPNNLTLCYSFQEKLAWFYSFYGKCVASGDPRLKGESQ